MRFKWILPLLLATGLHASVVYGPQAFNYPIGESLTVTAHSNYTLSSVGTPTGIIATDAHLLSTTAKLSDGSGSWAAAYQPVSYTGYEAIKALADFGTSTRVDLFVMASATWSGGWPQTGYIALCDSSYAYIYRVDNYSGSLTLLADAPYGSITATNFTMQLVDANGVLVVYVNGVNIINAYDVTYTSGYYGFGSYQGANYLTNVQVNANQPLPIYPVADPTPAPRNSLMPVPPLMWDVHGGATMQTSASAEADSNALITSGLFAKGWNTIHVDVSAWLYRDDNGFLVGSHSFPSFSSLAAFVHANGQKFSIYHTIGQTDCAGGHTGSYGYVTYDAQADGANGSDDLTVDDCSYAGGENARWSYQTFYNSSQASAHPPSFQFWGRSAGTPFTYASAVGGNSWYAWETDPATWANIMTSWTNGLAVAVATTPTAARGFVNLMEIRTGETGSDNQDRAQMGLWALINSPLFVYNVNLATALTGTTAILGNTDVIALDQDVASPMIYTPIVDDGAGHQIYMRSRSTGAITCAFLNTQTAGVTMFLPLTYTGIANTLTVTVHDEWAQADIGTTVGSYSVYVSGTSAALLDFAPPPTPTPTITDTFTATPTDTPTATPSFTVSPTDTDTFTPSGTPTVSPTPTISSTETPICQRPGETVTYTTDYPVSWKVLLKPISVTATVTLGQVWVYCTAGHGKIAAACYDASGSTPYAEVAHSPLFTANLGWNLLPIYSQSLSAGPYLLAVLGDAPVRVSADITGPDEYVVNKKYAFPYQVAPVAAQANFSIYGQFCHP